MSTIVKTEAVVLRSIDFHETSKIVTFYTRQYGKIAGIVKGARRPKNKYGSSLEPMSYVSLVFYKKEGRDVQTVSNCDVMKPFRYLYEDIDKMAIGMAIIELMNIVIHEREENAQLFSLLVNSLNRINSAATGAINLFYYFEIHLAKDLGFQPSFDHCVSCKRELKEILDGQTYRFHIERGGLVCTQCSEISGQKSPLTADALKILRQIITSNHMDTLLEIKLDEESKGNLESFILTYLQYHLHGLRPLKSDKVFSKIIDNTIHP